MIAMNLLTIANAFLVLNYKVFTESIVYTALAGFIIMMLNRKAGIKTAAMFNKN